ncbi:uncharacterized protein LOC121628195 [Melanotaenia boesemani]|uniref:uncharacterized protein LOC121628195 n=1 Tax=Melanotaenia boesemani TaxID=1250792 RepID=UPI001C048944|nr:uncharacterized protein LOC121628195 [Melanotaenia boesemani]
MKRSFPSKEKAMVKPTREVYLFPGVSTKLFECRRDKHDSVYLCGRCSRKIAEEDIVDHVTDLNHQKMRRVVVNVGEKTYNNISKQSFYTALHTLKALNLQRNSLNIRTSASKPSSARPGNASAALHVQHVGSTVDNFEVVDQERNSPADRVRHMPMTKRVQVPSSEAQTKTFMKLSTSAGSFHHYQSNNFGKRALNVPAKGSHVVRLLPYSRRNGSKDVTPSAICKKAATPPKMKRSAVISPSMPTISKCIKTSSARMGTNSSATFSRMASTSKIVPMSRTLEGERTATKAKSASFNAARATGLHEATCRTDALSRHKNTPRSTAANTSTIFQTKLTSVATPKGPKPGSENANASKNAHMENSLKANAAIGPHAHKGNPPAAPHLKTTLPAASEHKRQHKEPSHTSAGTKQSGNHPKVGLNQLIIVSWEGKQQVYCQLCSVRLKRSDHPLSLGHQYNYVKMKYPGWTSTQAELESKLKNIVAHLAEVEKNLGSQNAQKVEVKKDVYQKLALLPENEAVERVKVLVRPRDPRVTFSSSEDTAEVVRREVTSPCEVSSSDDVSGALVPFSEMPGFSAKSQLMQETKTDRQKLLDQITEKKCRLTTENDLAVYQSVRGQSLDGDRIHHQLPSSGALNKKHPLPIPAASSQAEVKAETVKHEPLEPDGDAQPHSEITLLTQTPVIKVEKTDHSQPLVNPDIRQEQKSDQTSREPQNDLESKQKLTPYQINSPNLEAATVSTGQLDLSGPSHSEGPREPKISQAFTVTSAGRIIQGSSHLSIFLKASRQDAKPIIGMDLVWECRGMSLETFFLCESCEETVSCRDICQHMASLDHELKYIWRKHPEFLRMFWHDESLPSSEKEDLVKRIVKELSERERFHKVDAQCVLLGKELHQFVKTSSFCEALKMVCDIKDEEKPNIVFLPINTRQKSSQQPEDCYSLVLKEQMTDQRSDSGCLSLQESQVVWKGTILL